jgi:hypothetical protein
MKESIVTIGGHQYRYGYIYGKTTYLGPVGDAPPIDETQFMEHLQNQVVTEEGIDIICDQYDAHVRLEESDGQMMVFVDVFHRDIEDPDEAYHDTEAFELSQSGVAEANDYIQDLGFKHKFVLDQTLKIRQI